MRLSLAFDAGLPRPHSAVILSPPAAFDAAGLEAQIVQGNYMDHQAWLGRGLQTSTDLPPGRWDMAIVRATRSKAQTQDLLAQAASCADLVVVDGQKTDGIDSHYKALRKRAEVAGTITKAHGRLFWFPSTDLSDWRAQPQQVDGFQTIAGVFSADGLDPASRALIAQLPQKLPGQVLDLGAGWGALSRAALERGAASVHLVEADHAALACAKHNLTDPRAQFEWGDARAHKGRYDWVVMNPPFHSGRKGDPSLGQAFIQTAARCLAPRGVLWMVANAHLPYEVVLEAHFGQITRHLPNRQFKIFEASRPKR